MAEHSYAYMRLLDSKQQEEAEQNIPTESKETQPTTQELDSYSWAVQRLLKMDGIDPSSDSEEAPASLTDENTLEGNEILGETIHPDSVYLQSTNEPKQEAIQPVLSEEYNLRENVTFGAIGFILGILVAYLYFSIKIKRIKAECETRISDARASLDKMISVIAKE